MKSILVGVASLMHLGRHAGRNDAEKPVEISRDHAQFLLGVASLLVNWCWARKPLGVG